MFTASVTPQGVSGVDALTHHAHPSVRPTAKWTTLDELHYQQIAAYFHPLQAVICCPTKCSKLITNCNVISNLSLNALILMDIDISIIYQMTRRPIPCIHWYMLYEFLSCSGLTLKALSHLILIFSHLKLMGMSQSWDNFNIKILSGMDLSDLTWVRPEMTLRSPAAIPTYSFHLFPGRCAGYE